MSQQEGLRNWVSVVGGRGMKPGFWGMFGFDFFLQVEELVTCYSNTLGTWQHCSNLVEDLTGSKYVCRGEKIEL